MSRSKRVMTMTLPSGMTLKIPYVADMMAFVHNDMQIRNPMMSECGRFGVDPVEAYGFEVWHSGGGCMALRKDLENGDYFLLTDSDGCRIPEAAEWATASYGRYTGGGTPYAEITLLDVPMDSEDGEPVEFMTVIVDGKEQQRLVDHVQVVEGRPSHPVPVLNEGEIIRETLGGAVHIYKL